MASTTCSKKNCSAENWDLCDECKASFCEKHHPPQSHSCGDAFGTEGCGSLYDNSGVAQEKCRATAMPAATPLKQAPPNKVIPFFNFPPPKSDLYRKRRSAATCAGEDSAPNVGEVADAEADGNSEPDTQLAQKKAKLTWDPPAEQSGWRATTPTERASDPRFKRESFIVSNSRLYCRACAIEFKTTKHSTSDGHCNSKSHRDALTRYNGIKTRQQQIKLELEKLVSKVPLDTRVRRYEVVRMLITEGIPLNAVRKGSPLRQLLETGSYSLGSVKDLAGFIPILGKEEMKTVIMELQRNDIKGSAAASASELDLFRPFSVIFDGTTTVADVSCFMVRFVTDDGYVQQRILALRHYKKALVTEELCNALFNLITGEPLHATTGSVLAFSSDRAAVNVAALHNLQPTFQNAEVLGCLSHTISNAGDRMENDLTSITFQFVSRWINIIGRSHKAREMFKERFGFVAKRANLTRWYARSEVIDQIGESWVMIEPFLQELRHEDVSMENVKEALALLNAHRNTIAIQVAAVRDLGIHLCKDCYLLEGDGFLAITAFDRITTLQQLLGDAAQLPMPNTTAAVTTITQLRTDLDMAGRNALRATLIEQARACVRPALVYLDEKLKSTAANGLLRLKNLFESCRLCNPARICHVAGTPAEVRTLLQRFKRGIFGLLTPFDPVDPAIDALITELPAYRAAALAFPNNGDALAFWRQHRKTLPRWSRLAFNVAVFQPSSACVERVFSMLEALLDDNQASALEDYRTAAIQTRYNNLQRKRLAELRAGPTLTEPEFDGGDTADDSD